jgi:hypothetical protein
MLETRSQCYSTLYEIIGLHRAYKSAPPSATHRSADLEQLESLSAKYLQDDDYGAAFRSMICYGHCGIDVSLLLFNQFIVLPASQYEFKLSPPASSLLFKFEKVDGLTQNKLHRDTLIAAHASVDFVLAHVAKHLPIPDQAAFSHLGPKNPWRNGILGHSVRSLQMNILDVPSLPQLQIRIETAIQYALARRKNCPRSFFFSKESAKAWCPEEITVDFESTCLLACSEFPSYLETLLKGSPHDFLDQHAGVILPSELYPEVEARIQKLMDLAPSPRVEGIDLMKGRQSCDKIGGTVVGIHQYLSPRFLAFYTVDHDSSCPYMRDYRSSHKKERKIRVSSTKHVNTKPVWLQFGESSDVHLYLSQKASVGEEAWLKIVNHLMTLLTTFVNQKIKSCHRGQKVPKEKILLPKVFSEIVSTVGHPTDANFGPHDDARNGTVSKGDPSFSRHLLMVVTLCLQNHAYASTKVAWCPKSDPKWVAGEIWHEFSLVHLQLLGVQDSFLHHVSTKETKVSKHLFYQFELDMVVEEDDKGDLPSRHGPCFSDSMEDNQLVASKIPLSYQINLNDSEEDEDKHEDEHEQCLDPDDARPEQLVDYLPIPKRLVASARVSFPLQAIGLKEILDDIDSGAIIHLPKVYGKPKPWVGE